MTSTKTCTSCHTNKPLEAFKRHAHTPDGRTYVCIDCLRARPRVFLATPDERRERQLARLRERLATDPDHRERVRQSRRKSSYGVTAEQHEAILEAQGGVCAICGGPPSDDRGYHLDHCHETNRVRGLLCGRCNTALGMLDDDSERLRAALRYLAGADTGIVAVQRAKRTHANCGTISGYQRHRRAGEVVCRACQEAWRDYNRAKRAAEPSKPKRVSKCGTISGYQKHRDLGEPTCDACKEARRTYQRDRLARKAAQS